MANSLANKFGPRTLISADVEPDPLTLFAEMARQAVFALMLYSLRISLLSTVLL